MKTRILFIACACLAFFACNHDPSGPGEIQVLSFGLNSTSRYNWSFVEEDTLGQQILWGSDTVVTRVASDNDIVGTNVGLTRMEAYSISHYIATTQAWYKSYPDSLVEIAYSSAGATPIVLPKRMPGTPVPPGFVRSAADYLRTPLAVRSLLKTRGIQDSVIERSDKRVVYVYPLSMGSTWVSFRHPFVQNRQVEGYETVVAGSRTFWCAKIRTSIPEFDSSLEWFDYVSWEGLIKRTISTQGVLLGTEENPDGPFITVSFTESMTLIE